MLKTINSSVLLETDAYHGSPYDFQTFNVEFMGSGEGNQAHGWGLYFALNKGIATKYNAMLSRYRNTEEGYIFRDKFIVNGTLAYTVLRFVKKGKKDKIIQYLQDLKNNSEFTNNHPHYKKNIDKIIPIIKTLKPWDVTSGGGQIFKVEIPAIKTFLNEQKPYDKQTVGVKKILKEVWKDNSLDDEDLEDTTFIGRDIYNKLVKKTGSKKTASQTLKSYGINGITYTGKVDNRCAVVFSDKDVRIVKKYRTPKFSSIKLDPNKNIEYLKYTDGVKNGVVTDKGFKFDLLMDTSLSPWVAGGTFPLSVGDILTDKGLLPPIDGQRKHRCEPKDYNLLIQTDTSVFDDFMEQNGLPYDFETSIKKFAADKMRQVFDPDDNTTHPYYIIKQAFSSTKSPSLTQLYTIFDEYSLAKNSGCHNEIKKEIVKQLNGRYPFIKSYDSETKVLKCFLPTEEAIKAVKSGVSSIVHWYENTHYDNSKGVVESMSISTDNMRGFDTEYWDKILLYYAEKIKSLYQHNRRYMVDRK